MENREKILKVLRGIHNRLDQLKEVIGKTTDQELENFLDYDFEEFGTNIKANFDLMEMIVTRKNPYADQDDSGNSKMTNEELEKFFEEHWDTLIFP